MIMSVDDCARAVDRWFEHDQNKERKQVSSNINFSVLIPVYNGENTIEKCLNSLLSQSADDVEIIVVDDGSTDGSAEICKEYAEKWTNLWFYSKENGGVSSARNVALNHATGKYVLFVDSDDYVFDNYFSTIRSYIDRYPELDSLVFSLAVEGKRNFCDILEEGYFDTELSIAQKFKKLFDTGMAYALMTKMFRRDIIEAQQIRFDERLAISEDSVFIFQYFLYIKSLVMSEKCLYCLREENDDSLSRKVRPYLKEHLLIANRKQIQSAELAVVAKPSKRLYKRVAAKSYYRSAYSCCKELKKYPLTASQRRKRIRTICSDYRAMHVFPEGLENFVIAMPIILGLSRVIDWMIQARR